MGPRSLGGKGGVMDAETARQERIMGIRRIVRQNVAAIEAKREKAASLQRVSYPPPANLRCVRKVRRKLRDTWANPVR